MARTKEKTSEVAGGAALHSEADGRNALRSRICGHADVSPALLKPHLKNFRRHPDRQKKALAASIDELGWVKSVIVSKRTGTILDGHARVEDALRRKLKSIPVEYVDLSTDEENKALALLDPITEMAQKDELVLKDLLDSIHTDNEVLNDTFDRMITLTDEKVLDVEPTYEGILEYKTDVYFPTPSKFGIPELRLDMCYDGPIPTQVWVPEQTEDDPCEILRWGSTALDERVTDRIMCFYTDDFRFEGVWDESIETLRKVMPLKPRAMMSPDFSLWADEPVAVQLYNFYRARWVARYWQEAGLKLIPSFASSLKPDVYDFIFEGYPKGIPVMSTQLISGGMKRREYVDAVLRDIGELIKRVEPKNLILYSTAPREVLEPLLPTGTNYHWVSSFMERRTHVNSGKRKGGR